MQNRTCQIVPSQSLLQYSSFLESIDKTTDNELRKFFNESKICTLRQAIKAIGELNYEKEDEKFFDEFNREFDQMG